MNNPMPKDNEVDEKVIQRDALNDLLDNLSHDAGDVDDFAPSIDDDEDAYWAYHQYHGIISLRRDAATVAELRAEVERLRAEWQASLGVGDGSGQLLVHGKYDSIKECQRKLLAGEASERRVGELDANDRRYRFLREKVCIIGAEHLSYTKAVFEFVNLPYPTYVAQSAAYELDAAIDALTGADPT